LLQQLFAGAAVAYEDNEDVERGDLHPILFRLPFLVISTTTDPLAPAVPVSVPVSVPDERVDDGDGDNKVCRLGVEGGD